jgi:hypothetical protein
MSPLTATERKDLSDAANSKRQAIELYVVRDGAHHNILRDSGDIFGGRTDWITRGNIIIFGWMNPDLTQFTNRVLSTWLDEWMERKKMTSMFSCLDLISFDCGRAGPSSSLATQIEPGA